MRTVLPSLIGLSPRSDFCSARSIAGICFASQGCAISMVASTTVSVATCFKGVGVPK